MIYTDCHTHHPESSAGIIRICNVSPGETFEKLPDHFSVGIHPKQINPERILQDMAELERLLAEPGCCAAGECGLDRFSPVAMDLQEQCFLCQAELAEKHDLPVILHCARYWPEVIRIRKQLRHVHPWVAHGFRSSPEMAKELLEHGIIPSFGTSLLSDERNSKVFASLPDNGFLLETDESALSIEQLYAKAAVLRNCTSELLSETMLANFIRIFTGCQLKSNTEPVEGMNHNTAEKAGTGKIWKDD